jgi:hypothetical protein
MARDGWFDGKGIDLHRNSFLDKHSGWKRYIADGRISASEMLEQETRVLDLIAKLEPLLDDPLHHTLSEIFLEYEVLVNMALVHQPVPEQTPYVAKLGQTAAKITHPSDSSDPAPQK